MWEDRPRATRERIRRSKLDDLARAAKVIGLAYPDEVTLRKILARLVELAPEEA